jgi:protease IV
MKRFLIGFLATVGALVFLGLAGAAGVVAWFSFSEEPLPARIVLEVDLDMPLVEDVPTDPLAQALREEVVVIRDVVAALEMAKRDDRVAGLVARIGDGSGGVAQVQELRDLVAGFRAEGKFAIAYADSFGEFGPGTLGYYLATAFDEIRVSPTGTVGLTGLIAEQPFVREALAKLGLTPRLDHREQYKTFLYTFTEDGFVEPHRESLTNLLGSLYRQIVGGIADRRGLDEAEVRALIDRGPFLAEEAVEVGLIDGLGYRDQVYEAARERAGEGAAFLYLSRYLDRTGGAYASGGSREIALVYGIGTIQRGPSGYNPITGATGMGSDTVAKAIRDAAADPDIAAIVFRIDSGGGSAVASDVIWREVVRASQGERATPVIVSMGNFAASGGYYVAMGADTIIAQPGTITGSIGVVAGKMLTSEFWEKLGVSWGKVQAGEHADMWTGTEDFGPSEYARFQEFLDATYEAFLSKAAAGRDLPIEQVREAAGGRVWTGEEAARLGLVDALGGLPLAIARAREAAGIPSDEPARIRIFPERRGPIEMLLANLLGDDEEDSSDSPEAALARTLRSVQPLAARIEALVGPDRGVLRMPDLVIGD